MTTDYHTAVVSTDSVNVDTINEILEALDQQISDLRNGDASFTAVDINGGNIDGATFGAATPGAITATNLTVTNNLNFGSAFVATIELHQYVAATSAELVGWNVEELDTDSAFDTTSAVHRFTPTVAGYYFLVSCVTWETADASTLYYTQIRKNGSAAGTRGYVTKGSFDESVSVAAMIQANGTTDYFDVVAYNGSANTDLIIIDDTQSFFAGRRVF